MAENKIRVDHLTKRFGDLLVLDDISFQVKKGEFICVVGPTGCGKTTFLNLLTRIYTPTSGELYIDDTVSFLHALADGEAESGIRTEGEKGSQGRT